jgi:hypothetical protein
MRKHAAVSIRGINSKGENLAFITLLKNLLFDVNQLH